MELRAKKYVQKIALRLNLLKLNINYSDHNFTIGIKELDNKLPPLGVYYFNHLFGFAIVYMVRYHVFNDYNQDAEYLTEWLLHKPEIEEYKKNAKDLVRCYFYGRIISGCIGLKCAGKAIFESKTVLRHMADGGGEWSNLTDKVLQFRGWH